MARLTRITGKNEMPAEHHAIVDAIVESRGAVQGPFTMFLHCPPLAERVMRLGAYVRFEGKLDHRVRVLAAPGCRVSVPLPTSSNTASAPNSRLARCHGWLVTLAPAW